MTVSRRDGAGNPYVAHVGRLVEIRRRSVRPEQPILIIEEVSAQMRTILPLMHAGQLALARDTADQAAASLIVIAMLIDQGLGKWR